MGGIYIPTITNNIVNFSQLAHTFSYIDPTGCYAKKTI